MTRIFPFLSSTWHIPLTPALLLPSLLPPSSLLLLCALFVPMKIKLFGCVTSGPGRPTRENQRRELNPSWWGKRGREWHDKRQSAWRSRGPQTSPYFSQPPVRPSNKAGRNMAASTGNELFYCWRNAAHKSAIITQRRGSPDWIYRVLSRHLNDFVLLISLLCNLFAFSASAHSFYLLVQHAQSGQYGSLCSWGL